MERSVLRYRHGLGRRKTVHMGLYRVRDASGRDIGTYHYDEHGPSTNTISVNGSLLSIEIAPTGPGTTSVSIPQMDILNSNMVAILESLREEIAFWRIRSTEMEAALRSQK